MRLFAIVCAALPAAALAVFATGCVHHVAEPSPSAPPPARGAPLPQGWAWPPGAGQMATHAFQPGVVRPVDAARLRSARPGAGCRPMEVSPGIFVMPQCAPLPRVSTGAHARRRRSHELLPPQMDLRQTGQDGPVKDQQQVGVCWSFAISTIMDNAVRRAAKADVIAPLHVLAADTLAVLQEKAKSDRPFVLEPTWPYDPVKACKLNDKPSEVWCEDAYHVQKGSWREDPALSAEVNRANATGTYRITKMEPLEDPADPEAYAEALAKGQAVYGAFEIDGVEWSHPRNGMIGDYANGDRGDHAVAVVGYRQGRGRELLVHNSWGAHWGDGGYAWLSEAMVRAHGHDAFVVEVDTGAPNPLAGVPGVLPGVNLPVQLPFPIPGLPQAQPQPQPSPSGGGCAVKDVVFGTCAAACPNGSPPVAGLCAPASPQGGGSAPAAQCAAGQVLDWATHTCVAQCQSGLPPVGGRCFP